MLCQVWVLLLMSISWRLFYIHPGGVSQQPLLDGPAGE